MENEHFVLEEVRPFADSLIWQLSRDYYEASGVDAWRTGTVPHHMTSSSMVGKTYAELIFASLKDLAVEGPQETVYLLELGAGHGRLSFHILKHLAKLTAQKGLDLPPYCYVISDIVEENLRFFEQHFQLQTYFEQGVLDVAYFDATANDELFLRYSEQLLVPQSLMQPLLVIANYFFDSLPNDLLHFHDQQIKQCGVSLELEGKPEERDPATLLEQLKVVYHDLPQTAPFYEEVILNEILDDYQRQLSDTYILFPRTSLACIKQLKAFSQQGLLLLTMDKGYHQIDKLKGRETPDMVRHGSLSFSVNYHAFSLYCEKQNGLAYFPAFSTFDLQLGCLLFTPKSQGYTELSAAYQRVVDDYGPDDFNGLKKLSYKLMGTITLVELLGLLRLSSYDSTLFLNLLPRLKEVARSVTFEERKRLAQTIHLTWEMYFTIRDGDDLAFEMAGIFYTLGFYQEALTYFQYSINEYGHTADGFYNRILCFYQLRQDDFFAQTLEQAQTSFPDYERFAELGQLDLNAK